MRDPRADNLAKILVGYSTEVQPGEIVSVEGDVGAAPLLHAVYEEILKAGAHPILNVALDGVAASYYTLASDEQLEWVSPVTKWMVEEADVRIGIGASANTRELSAVPPERQTRRQSAVGPVHVYAGLVTDLVIAVSPLLVFYPGLDPLETFDDLVPAVNRRAKGAGAGERIEHGKREEHLTAIVGMTVVEEDLAARTADRFVRGREDPVRVCHLYFIKFRCSSDRLVEITGFQAFGFRKSRLSLRINLSGSRGATIFFSRWFSSQELSTQHTAIAPCCQTSSATYSTS